MKRSILVMAAAVAASATLPAETFTVGDWELTGGGNAALTLSYKGRKLLSDVTLGGWTDGYKRGTFGGRGYAVRREGDMVTFAKTGPNANVKLAVTLAKGRAAFAMDVDILKEFGPVEYGFNIPLDSFAEKDGSVWPMVGRTFCPIEPGHTFESVGGRRLAFEYPDAQYAFTVLEGNAFALQDRRHEGRNHVRFIACRRSTEPCRLAWCVRSPSTASSFGSFLKEAAKESPTGRIVVLIDEHDEPVAKFLDDLDTLKKVRSALHDFYEKLKSNSGSIRFLMMTGVTKLAKLSVFSGLNHLTDVSMSPDYATLLGYTPDELDGPLRENVEASASS